MLQVHSRDQNVISEHKKPSWLDKVCEFAVFHRSNEELANEYI